MLFSKQLCQGYFSHFVIRHFFLAKALDSEGNESDINLCKPHKTIHLLTSLNTEYNVAQLDDSYRGVCAVGTTKRKKFIQQALALELQFTKIIHPSARIPKTTLLADGTIINVGAIIGAKSKIGHHVILNRGCLIGHHVQIGDYVTISPGANIAGSVRIADCSYVGMGAVILDGISIGCNSVVGAGAVVTRDVPDHVQVVGVPAHVVKELD